jgi:hypothetical protein
LQYYRIIVLINKINSIMISRTTIKRCYAWMLLITFTLMLSLRGIHYHYEKSHDCDVKTTESTACTTIKAVCNVCDFVFQKANAIKNTVYITPVPYSIVKYLSFDTPCVYLRILSINTNSPPFFLA